jgi:F0F1-type ATP synthase assembly protein I
MQSNEPQKNDDLKSEKRMLNNYARYSAMGFQMFVIIGLFTYLGYYIDDKRQASTPLFTAFLSLLGVFISLYLVIRSIKNQKS